MKIKQSINVELNKALGSQLVAINQYFLHARILKNWGFGALGKTIYGESIQAMKDADELIERILFLEGLPNLQNLGKLLIGENAEEILKNDLTLETETRAKLLMGVSHCEKEGDYISRDLLTKILEESEERIDFYETQFELIGKMGLENYLQSAVGEVEKS
ncbi:MAG: bacterioferritin [Oligoflexia bacterium]|nr:bacterioferritin [Oligoflexia bacterium]